MSVSNNIIWQPQPGPQTWLCECPVYDVLFGGSRGGGKTDGMLGEWAQHASEYGRHASGIFLRKELPQLDDAIKRSYELYSPFGSFKEQKKTWVFDNGATLRFRPLERDKDAEKYQGHSYTRVYAEELTNFPDSTPIDKMHATLRSAHGVPVGFRATANPGGPGHQWVKERYIDPCPAGKKLIPMTDNRGKENGLFRVFIPSKLVDNDYLGEDYVRQLEMLGSEDLVRAWLHGDWDIVAGAAFEKLSRNIHMIRPFPVPDYWTKFMSIDWGTAKPFSVGWYTVVEGWTHLSAKHGYDDIYLPDGAVVRYREWYGWNGNSDEGIRMESPDVAKEILQTEKEAKEYKVDGASQISYRVGDSGMWAQSDGPSPQEKMAIEGVYLQQSKKDRAANYTNVRDYIWGEEFDGERHPMFYITDNCSQFWRTVPTLMLDERDVEKGPDTRMEDHVYDEVAYALATRPYRRMRTEAGYLSSERKRILRKYHKGKTSDPYRVR